MVAAETVKYSLGSLIERRAVARQSVNEEGVKLVWRDGVSRFSRTGGRLVDISEKGAGILSGPIARQEDVLWIGLVRLPWEWVKANIRATRLNGEQWCYHLEFTEPCPPGFLEIVARSGLDELILMWNPE